MRLKSMLAAGAIGVFTLAATAGLGLFSGDPDYSALPPDAGSMHKSLSDASMSLTEAIEAASKTVDDGVASSANILREGIDVTGFEVQIYSTTELHNVTLDPSGEVKESVVVPRFPGEAVTGEPTKTESGLMFYDLVVGDGETPPAATSRVKVHYTGWLVDGTKFDSSRDRGQPITFPLNRVIRGWTEGVGSMRIGGTRKLIIPSNLGYGPQGAGGSIPPNATLIFDVELIDVEE